MPRLWRHLMIHDAQDAGVHRVHTHHGCQLQQALFAIPRPHGVERGGADLGRLKQLTSKANDQRLVRRQAVQRSVRINFDLNPYPYFFIRLLRTTVVSAAQREGSGAGHSGRGTDAMSRRLSPLVRCRGGEGVRLDENLCRNPHASVETPDHLQR